MFDQDLTVFFFFAAELNVDRIAEDKKKKKVSLLLFPVHSVFVLGF